jgi:hypothetical protein
MKNELNLMFKKEREIEHLCMILLVNFTAEETTWRKWQNSIRTGLNDVGSEKSGLI